MVLTIWMQVNGLFWKFMANVLVNIWYSKAAETIKTFFKGYVNKSSLRASSIANRDVWMTTFWATKVLSICLAWIQFNNNNAKPTIVPSSSYMIILIVVPGGEGECGWVVAVHFPYCVVKWYEFNKTYTNKHVSYTVQSALLWTECNATQFFFKSDEH